jgi:hypothetical protein
MIHKVNGFDFVVADSMPKLLKLEASLKDDESKPRLSMETSLNEVISEIPNKAVSIFDMVGIKSTQRCCLLGILYFGASTIINFVSYLYIPY